MHQHQLRAFGLALVAALGLMAFMAVGAQAEETLKDGGKAGLFLVNSAAAVSGTTFAIAQEGTGTLLVPTRVDILCTGGTVTDEFKSDTEALGSAEFTGCTAWAPVATFPHVTKLPCTVNNPQAEVGKIIVEKAKALAKKHEGEPYILFEEDGIPLAIVLLEGAECGLTKKNEIKGSVVGKIDKSDTLEPLVLLSQAIQKLFQVGTEGDHLKFGGLESYIDAEGHAKGTGGTNTGKILGVC